MKIGVFDSGVGGLSVAKAIERAFPAHEVVYVNDVAHVPYGTKTADEIYNLASPKINELYERGCNPIVLACNTLTMTNKPRLEAAFPVQFIGLEPMIKPAALETKTGTIIVCATPATLASERYKELKSEYASQVTVIEPDCSDWASLIEANTITEARIRQAIEPGLSEGADVIVLACTHYHWIEKLITAIAGEYVTVLQPEAAVLRRLSAMQVPELRP